MYFDDEDGKKYNKAYFDGYHVGDRLLEDVWFEAYIENNTLKVKPASEEDEDYLDTLNKKMWLDNALAYAEDNDIFADKPHGEKELCLFNDDGTPYKK
jgi:hypothetical protein